MHDAVLGGFGSQAAHRPEQGMDFARLLSDLIPQHVVTLVSALCAPGGYVPQCARLCAVVRRPVLEPVQSHPTQGFAEVTIAFDSSKVRMKCDLHLLSVDFCGLLVKLLRFVRVATLNL